MSKADEIYVQACELFHAGVIDDDRYWDVVEALDVVSEAELDEIEVKLSKTLDRFFGLIARL